MELEEPYRPRRVRPLGLWDPAGWRIKVYTIAYEGEKVADTLVEAAKVQGRRVLPEPAVTEDRHGVGFLGVHEGRGANLVVLDWWVNENELVHHAWTSEVLSPAELQPTQPGEPSVSAWDLRVMAHERTAWVEHVLAGTGGPDLDHYLADRLDGWY